MFARGQAREAVKKDALERLEYVEKKVEYIDGHMRKRAAALLFVGALFGMLGFIFAFVTGLLKSLQISNEYPSGWGYFPSTVSEMVSDPRDPAGKAFFAFEFMGAMFIFLSWYPWELKSVYLGDDEVPCCGVSWTMYRQFVPAPGMMLVATVTTTPIAIATTRDCFTIFIHLTGAMMMFVGYMVIEMKTLAWTPTIVEKLGWKVKPPTAWKDGSPIGERERVWRILCLRAIFWCYVGFFSIQIILGVPGVGAVICCNDVWQQLPGDTALTLMNSAHNKFLVLKVLSYVGEVVCGLALIISHMTIWKFSGERHIDLDDMLTKHHK